MDIAKELEILDPDRGIEIGGEPITVREYTWPEGIRLGAIAAPILDDLSHLFTPSDEPTLEGLQMVLEKHWGLLYQMIAVSIDRSVDWIERLSDADGLLLLHAYWRVNSGFFVRRLIMRSASRPADESA